MEKITIILTVSVLRLALAPLVSGRCDQEMLSECTKTFSRAFNGFAANQNIISTMKMFCRSDVLSAVICIEEESANFLDDTSYASVKPLMRMVNAKSLQESCNVFSKIPENALNCLNKALDISNTQLMQCVMSASANVVKSLTQTGLKDLNLCSLIRYGQKCLCNAIAETCPDYINNLSVYKKLATKFFSCSDLNSSAGKTPMTSILIAACFAILSKSAT